MKAWPEHFESKLCITSSRAVVGGILDLFELEPDYELAAFDDEADLSTATQAVLAGVKKVLADAKPDVALVQGDTTTTFAAALGCFYSRVPVGHVEAGVRSDSKFEAFPEEIHRRLADCLCDIYFAPTNTNRDNLLAEGCPPDSVVVTGNTVIDAITKILPRVRTSPLDIPQLDGVDWSNKTLLLTCHRRESYGEDLPHVCHAAKLLLEAHPHINVICPVHSGTSVRGTVEETLGGLDRCYLIDPPPYVAFVGLMDRAHLILTDSDGIQEEAPTLDTPVLVLRAKTERPEALEAGTVKLVGTESPRIVTEVEQLLSDPESYYNMAEARNPYGDGKAGIRVVNALYRRYR
jgi:UDP-N-acetylglucosamine 2-epimerase (non-hydrolysing)